jgi:iron complex transport system substrate-binding protein
MDVVSLLPSATEVCYAVGVEPVGVSHECDHPPAASERPAMNYSVVDDTGSSEDINQQVADAEREGNGVYAIDREALAAVDPDLILTQGVCDVCAVDRVLVAEAVADLGLDAEVMTLDAHSLADVFEDVRRVGAATGREQQARRVVADLRERVDAVRERAAEVAERPTVAVLDWMDPVMVAGHWVPGMVETVGGRYGLEEPGGRSRAREWREIREYDPEVLVAAPCGFEPEQTRANADELTGRPGWGDLTAVREGRTYVMDGHHHVNRPGPRLVDTLEQFARVVHPDVFGEPDDSVVTPLRDGAVEAD